MKRLLAVMTLLAAAAVLGVFAATATAQSTDEGPAVTVFCIDGQTADLSDPDNWDLATTLSQWLDTSPVPTIYWTAVPDSEGYIYFSIDNEAAIPSPDEGLEWVEVTVGEGACVVAPVAPVWAPEPSRIAYCSVAGNALPNGTPLVPGTFLNLLAGQPGTDTHYTGATPAFWVEGVGLTCSLTPAQAALASASTVKVGGGGTPLPAEFGGFYTFIPLK